jgi:hypothetical protein
VAYEIEINKQPDYLFVNFINQANLEVRDNLTNDLIKVCKESEIFNVIIDTTEMNHPMAPIDFFAFADAFCGALPEHRFKMAIVTRRLETFTVLTRIVMNCKGITNTLVNNKEQAIQWLLKDNDV